MKFRDHLKSDLLFATIFFSNEEPPAISVVQRAFLAAQPVRDYTYLVNKRLIRCFTITVVSAVWPELIVIIKPLIYVILQRFHRVVGILSKSSGIEFPLNGFVKKLTNNVGLRRRSLRFSMNDILTDQVLFKFIEVNPTTKFSTPIGKYTQQLHTM